MIVLLHQLHHCLIVSTHFTSMHVLFTDCVGGWSFALKDYLALNITQYLDSPNVTEMMSIIDPYVYADVLTMPKLIVDSTG